MRDISFLSYNGSFIYFFPFPGAIGKNQANFSQVSISAWSHDICIMIENDPFTIVFVNWQRDIGTSATQGDSSSCSSSSLSRTCGIGTRNVISREIGQPVRRLTSTWLTVLVLRFSFFPPFRAPACAGTACSSDAITVGPSLHELIGTWLIRELWLNYSTTLRVAVYVGSLENAKSILPKRCLGAN